MKNNQFYRIRLAEKLKIKYNITEFRIQSENTAKLL